LIDDEAATERWIRNTYGEPSTEAVVGTGIVFDGVFGGNSLNLALPLMPSFFWMNNGTSSFFLVGTKLFFDRTWYRGTRWWYGGFPHISINLTRTPQDNRYESCL
jgi:hypothetical protein